MNVKAIILQTPKINTIKNDEMEKKMHLTYKDSYSTKDQNH